MAENMKEQTNSEKLAQNAKNAIANETNSLISKLNSKIDSYVQAQEKMAYGLIGYSRNLNDINATLNKAFAGNWLVKQEDVFKNVSALLKSGIVYNVEQRAFLQTLADDLGSEFKVYNATLTRLVNLQRIDSTENRLALEYSLKEFLNQNFENSQYIVNSFQKVSDALIEAQSLMTSQNAVALESTIQKWLGSLESVGMSSGTIGALATAIGQLGSGDVSGLASGGIGNLIMMGASQAGLSYADLLTRGVTGQDADKLIKGIVNYIISMGDQSSNVVKSEYAKIFGINVSDIVAAQNLAKENAIAAIESSSISTNINYLLKNYGSLVPYAQKISNFGDNLLTGVGNTIADGNSYLVWKLANIASDLGNNILGGVTISTPLKGILGGADIPVSAITSLLPLVHAAVESIPAIGNAFTNIGLASPTILNTLNTFKDGSLIDKVSTLGDILTGKEFINIIGDFISGDIETNMLMNAYNRLGASVTETQKIISSGYGLGARGTGETTSQVVSIGDKSQIDSLRSSLEQTEAEMIEAREEHISEQAIYKLIQDYINDDAIPFARNTHTLQWVTSTLAEQLAEDTQKVIGLFEEENTRVVQELKNAIIFDLGNFKSELMIHNLSRTGSVLGRIKDSSEYLSSTDPYSIKNIIESIIGLPTEISTYPFATYTKLIEGGNTVEIGTNDNTTYIRDMLTITAVNTENIFLLLNNVLNENVIDRGVTDLFGSENPFTTRYGDLFTVPGNIAAGG